MPQLPVSTRDFSIRTNPGNGNGTNTGGGVLRQRFFISRSARFLFCASNAAGYAASLGRPIEKEGQENEKKQRKS
jgi:N-methylhydantoinase B/oxoprolinase/acetone carboxylase alpha subunit